MVSKNVLVLGNHSRHLLPNILKDLGFSPDIRGSVLHSLEHLQKQRVAAVVVDRDFTHADVLEFLLNVKDIDDSLPVVVVGRTGRDSVEQALRSQRQAAFIDDSKNKKALASKLGNILSLNPTEHC